MRLHIKLLGFILAVLVNLSWAEVTPTLNSDAIKATFGSYGVAVSYTHLTLPTIITV